MYIYSCGYRTKLSRCEYARIFAPAYFMNGGATLSALHVYSSEMIYLIISVRENASLKMYRVSLFCLSAHNSTPSAYNCIIKDRTWCMLYEWIKRWKILCVYVWCTRICAHKSRRWRYGDMELETPGRGRSERKLELEAVDLVNWWNYAVNLTPSTRFGYVILRNAIDE